MEEDPSFDTFLNVSKGFIYVLHYLVLFGSFSKEKETQLKLRNQKEQLCKTTNLMSFFFFRKRTKKNRNSKKINFEKKVFFFFS